MPDEDDDDLVPPDPRVPSWDFPGAITPIPDDLAAPTEVPFESPGIVPPRS